MRDKGAVVRITESVCDGGASGSGFLIDARHVVTVAHVVSDATGVVVRREDGRVAVASVVGIDEEREVALLELDRDLDTAVTLRFAKKPVQQLDDVGAIGYPLGGALTTTTGQVTAVNTRYNIGNGQTLKGLVQFNAGVSHGSSGGPVVDRQGRVVGLVEAGREEGNDLYYAVPNTTAEPLVDAWLASPDSPAEPDCPPSDSPVQITSRHPDAVSIALSLRNYFSGIDAKDELLTLTDGSQVSGWELAQGTLTEDLAKRYPDAESLRAVYADTSLTDVVLEKAQNTGPLEDWAEVSWSNTTDGTCERHKARFTLRLDSGFWQLSQRRNLTPTSDSC